MKIISQRGFVLLALLGLVATLALATAAGAATDLQPLEQAPSAETGQMTDESPKYWFVEFPTAPLADGSSAAAVDSDGAEFRQEASSEGASYKQRLEFKTLWNGVSIEAKSGAIAKIRQFDSVKAVYPVQTHGIPVTTKVSPDLATALAMTGADIAQNELGLTGEGVKVAVMDTGIDYDHPDLGGCFGPGCRVVTGCDFVGDAYNADPASPGLQPGPDAGSAIRTTATATARTSPASSAPTARSRGVAPGVTFGAYRVFGCEGSTTADIMIAAMERDPRRRHGRAQHEHRLCVHKWPQYPTAAAADRLVKKGIVVVASIGNSGASGLYSAGAPGVGEDVIGVASFDNSHVALTTFTVSPDGDVDRLRAAPPPRRPAPTSGTRRRWPGPARRRPTDDALRQRCRPGA